MSKVPRKGIDHWPMYRKANKGKPVNQERSIKLNQSIPAFSIEIVLNDRYKQAPPFTDDDIRRTGLPKDVFGILHDLAYHHDGRDVWDYVKRAQAALRKEK